MQINDTLTTCKWEAGSTTHNPKPTRQDNKTDKRNIFEIQLTRQLEVGQVGGAAPGSVAAAAGCQQFRGGGLGRCQWAAEGPILQQQRAAGAVARLSCRKMAKREVSGPTCHASVASSRNSK